MRGGNEAKIWLDPVRVAYHYGYHRSELNHIVKLTQEYQKRILEVWYGYFGS
ncbi:MAG: DUF4160 domain-containing protein [Chloroflexaceae bacterium]|nr:DUF4160 domain-containing protein [Chloroflexaceae bacterium]